MSKETRSLATRSYAQNGEDLICAMLLGKRDNVTYVDVGCLWPVQQSNTYLFYERGGHGLCIDPNPSAGALYREVRPRDVFVNAGVAEIADRRDYYSYQNPVYNTFSAEKAKQLERKTKAGCTLLEVVQLEVMPLADILRNNGFLDPAVSVDLLSIDSEGYEDVIIKSIDFSVFKPVLIIFECIIRGQLDINIYEMPMVQYLSGCGYYLAGFTGHDVYMRRRTVAA